MTIFAVISGAESWEDIEDFGETHLDFLKQYGDFENGIPVHDTIARVVSCISPAKFHECFINWMRDCHSSNDKDVIAIDGKTLRHSYDKSRRRGAIHVISAFSTMHSLVIGQIKTDEKSNEITAIPELLNMLDIKGKIITTDAMGCQKDIAEKIQKQGGDYLFAVKGNQGWLNKAFEEKFPLKELNNPEHDSYAHPDSTMHSLVLGQIKTDEKSNEITAIPELLNMMDIKGKIITTDAMGCQKDIAEKIQKQGGDYLFAVKGNQGRLNKAFEEKFPLKELNNPKHDSYAISEKSHGREETRLHIVCDVPDELIDFTFE